MNSNEELQPERVSEAAHLIIPPGKVRQSITETGCAAGNRIKIEVCHLSVAWVVRQVLEHKWSLDSCAGRAKRRGLCKQDEMVCCKTLYTELAAGNLPLTLFEVPQVLGRKKRKSKNHVNKRPKGRSINERPSVVDERIELGHWEIDTVVGRRQGKEAVVLSLVERVTDEYIALQIPGRTSDAVMNAMRKLRLEYGDKFNAVFKSFTADNASEFEDLAQVERVGFYGLLCASVLLLGATTE